jgi:predicted Zn-dependent protease with MMP-like domain
MMQMRDEAFERIVAKAIDALPEAFLKKLDNVAVVIEEAPSAEQLRENGIEDGGSLYGLYEGIAQPDRSEGYTFVLPDKITVFRRPILEDCETEEDVRHEVQHTIVHEIAHHFGISDERLEELGKY